MRVFAAFERFFERIFERPSARLFHARLQPIQLQRRVERSMENARLSAADRVVVPNRYTVRLAPADLRAFGDFADSLELELGDAALKFARAHRYSVADRPVVRLVADPAVSAGDARVEPVFSDGTPPAEHAAAAEGELALRRGTGDVANDHGLAPRPEGGDGIRAAGHPRRASPQAAAGDFVSAGAAGASAASPPGSAASRAGSSGASRATAAASSFGAPADVAHTMIFAIPKMDAPLATLREVAPDGSQRELALDGGPVTIGRATDNTLVLRDSRVSRHHGRLAARQGALVYSDLGSANGSRVNGVDVHEVVLGAGDRIELGDTVLVVESVAGA